MKDNPLVIGLVYSALYIERSKLNLLAHAESTFQRKSRDKLSSDKIKRDKLFPFGNAKLATPPLIFRVGGVFITAQHFNNFFWGFVWWCCEFDLPLIPQHFDLN